MLQAHLLPPLLPDLKRAADSIIDKRHKRNQSRVAFHASKWQVLTGCNAEQFLAKKLGGASRILAAFSSDEEDNVDQMVIDDIPRKKQKVEKVEMEENDELWDSIDQSQQYDVIPTLSFNLILLVFILTTQIHCKSRIDFIINTMTKGQWWFRGWRVRCHQSSRLRFSHLQYANSILSTNKGPLREWIVLERPRRHIRRQFKSFLLTFEDEKHQLVYPSRIEVFLLHSTRRSFLLNHNPFTDLVLQQQRKPRNRLATTQHGVPSSCSVGCRLSHRNVGNLRRSLCGSCVSAVSLLQKRHKVHQCTHSEFDYSRKFAKYSTSAFECVDNGDGGGYTANCCFSAAEVGQIQLRSCLFFILSSNRNLSISLMIQSQITHHFHSMIMKMVIMMTIMVTMIMVVMII